MSWWAMAATLSMGPLCAAAASFQVEDEGTRLTGAPLGVTLGEGGGRGWGWGWRVGWEGRVVGRALKPLSLVCSGA